MLFCIPVGHLRSAEPEQSAGPVVVIDLDTDISKAQFLYLRRALKEAEAGGASAVILNMNTYGGDLNAAIKTMEALLRVKVPVYTYVNNNAGSAGALIALATDSVYMAPVSAIGAAAPVQGGGEDIPETINKKIVSYFGGFARSVAEQKGHNPDLVAAFTDADAEMKIGETVISPVGSLLTLSASEAVREIDGKPVFAKGIVSTVDELIDREKLGRTRIEVRPSGFEHAALWLTRLAPVFLVAGMLGAYLEFKTPGFGLFGVASAVAFLLFFTGHYVAGLTGHGTMLVFFLGVALVMVELFLLPGTLIPGILGLCMMLGSLLVAMIDKYPAENWSFSADMLAIPVLNMAIAFILAAGAALLLARFLPNMPFYKGLVLQNVAGAAFPNDASPFSEAKVSLIGHNAKALSPLRPSGKVEIDGSTYDAVSTGDFIEAGDLVRVCGESSGSLLVEIQNRAT